MEEVKRIQLLKGDITTLKVDVIVNAANSGLGLGSGVNGAIQIKGGPAILLACQAVIAEKGPVEPGNAVVTTAGDLPAKYVIHTVGPVWQGGEKQEQQALTNCYLNSCNLAVELDCHTIAFPNISTGVYGYPKKLAAITAINAVRAWLHDSNYRLSVIFICYDEENYRYYQQLLSNPVLN